MSRELPNDVEMEKALLGCLFIEHEKYFEIADLELAPDDFFDQNHRIIFEAIQSIVSKSETIDLATVGAELRSQDQLQALGKGKGFTFLTEVAESGLTASLQCPYDYCYAEVDVHKSTLPWPFKSLFY